MRKTIVAGNWKMNASKEFVDVLVEGILSGLNGVESKVIVCAPFPYLSQVESLIGGSSLMLGAQNLSVNPKGAFLKLLIRSFKKEILSKHFLVETELG